MLAIRMQRTGRKGHAMFRVVVQDSRRTPTSGKIVAGLGSYDPHTKSATLDKEKAVFYLEHGAQPSDRVALLLKKEGVKLPKWVQASVKQEGKVRNPDKRRSTRPDEPETPQEPAEEKPAEEAAEEEAPAEEPESAPKEAEEKTAEKSDEKTVESGKEKQSEDKKSAE
jgi:small subunit ribosomal protein S16